MGYKIRLFGEFSIKANDTEIISLSPRHQALITGLTVRAPSPLPRSELAFRLWADSSEEQALTNLRKALHYIKKICGDDLILADTRTLRFNPDLNIQLDLTDFTSAVDSAARARRSEDAHAEIIALETALTFYRGDLLPAFYDDWLISERYRLRRLFIESTDRLIALLEARKHYRDAIKHAQRLLQTDNLREETYRTLIRLHALNNDRAAALNVYHTCASVLSTELDVEPDTSTRELYERLLKNDARILQVNTPILPISHPLVAREQEWKMLLGAWKLASSGNLRMSLLSGEAGIGKTRLAEELLHWADRQGMRTGAAACYSAEGQTSFAPVAGWLRSLSLGRLDSHWQNELARILPELRDQDITPQPMTESWQRQVFFEAMARALTSQNEPLVLLLDDIQWCDNDTLEWLRYFMRFNKKTRILILVTLRVEELPANTTLQSLLVDLRSAGQITEMELNRLDEKQTTELGIHLLGKKFSETNSVSLFRASEGVPLFVVELANTGFRGEAVYRMEAGTDVKDLPPRLKAILEGRLARLSAPAHAVIESAAIIGREFEFDLLHKISELDDSTTIQALDELWRTRMVRERGGRYDFSHDKLREVTLGGISPIRLRWLHQRAAEALEAEDSGETYTRIADHFERAGKQAKASEYFARAAGHSGQLFAFDEALEYYRRAIVLENRTAKVADLYEGRGDVLKLLGVRDDAFHAFEQALNLTEASLQMARLARKQIDLISRFDHNLAQEKYATASFEIARAVNEPGYWHEWIEIQFVWLQACYWRQDLESQETMLAQIREPVRESGTPLQQVKYWHHFINCQFVRERYFLNKSHVALARENLERAAALDDSHMFSTARQQYGMVVLAAEQFELSETMFREAIALSEKNGNYQSLLIARTYISVAHRRMKRLETVRADISELDRVLQKSNKNPQYAAVADANRAWLAYHDGKLDEARGLAQAALDTWGTQASKFPACWLAAFILLALGMDDGDVDEIIARSRFMLTPYYQRLRLDVEAALHTMLEVDPANHDLVIRLGREAVEKAKEAGYL